ncbi:MAG: toll/interleukin-1 receptor domain-containing protein [Anaerolineales bacterium]|nr:toll/interleukin-1 receptor domain-containing protein [Anaerolineales bacterium]
MSESIAVRKTKIFISYSRKDKLFVRKLNDAIDAADIDAWVDWEGIPLSSDWMAEISAAITGGDAFVFVISPDSPNLKSARTSWNWVSRTIKRSFLFCIANLKKDRKCTPNWLQPIGCTCVHARMISKQPFLN